MKDISNLPVVYEAENALLAIEEEYSIVPDCTTKEGYALAKLRIHDLVTLRTGLETRRKEKKAGALAYGRRLDACAKDLKARIEKLELKHKDAKHKVDAEKARIKREEKERKETILKRIDAITKFSDTTGLSSEEIAVKIEKLSTAVINDERYQEFRKEAEEAKDRTGAQLEAAMGDALDKEAEERAEQEERERIAEEQRIAQVKLDAEKVKLNAEKAELKAEKKRIKQEQDDKAAEAQAEINQARDGLEAKWAAKCAEAEAEADEKQVKLDSERAELKAEKARLAKIEQDRLDKEALEKEEAERAAEEEANAERRNERRDQARSDMLDVAHELPADDEDEDDVRTVCYGVVDAIIDGKISYIRFLG